MEATLKVEFRESRVGNEMLLINGCKYMVNRRSGDTVYWRCVYSWCHSRAVFKTGQLRSARGTHVCPQPLQNESSNKNLQLQSNSGIAGLQIADTGYIYETSEANSSFLEFVEDKSISIKIEAPDDDDFCDADLVWKKRILKGLKVYSEAEQHRRFKIAYENHKAWIDNREHFTEQISGLVKKWTTSNSKWTYSNDWPTRSNCMKLIKPVRGSGVFVEQPLVPIKIIEHINPLLHLPIQSIEEKGNRESSEMENVIKNKSVKIRHEEKVVKNGTSDGNFSEMNVVKNKAFKSLKNEGKCPICGKVFQSSLERHLNVHYGIKPYKCTKCDKEHSFRSHARLHNYDQPFSCTICPKKFTSKGGLKKHIISHSRGKTFSCNVCGKIFRKTEFLQFHTYKFHPKQKLASKLTPDVDGERGSKRAFRGKTSSPKRIACNFNKEDEKYTSKISKRMGLVEEERRKRREQAKLHTDEKAEASKITKRQFTLDELKYADFLQPKVVLSEALNVIISQMTSESERSKTCSNDIKNLWFHNYAKPFKF